MAQLNISLIQQFFFLLELFSFIQKSAYENKLFILFELVFENYL